MSLPLHSFADRSAKLSELDRVSEWPEAYRIASELRNDGYIDEAIYGILVLLKRYSSNADAEAWGYYTLFGLLAEDQGIDVAVPYLDKILESKLNFVAKSNLISIAVAHLRSTDKKELARSLIKRLEEICQQKLDQSSFSSDDINIHLATRLGHEAHALEPGQNSRPFSLYKNTERFPSIYHLPPQKLVFQEPKLFNRIPAQIESYRGGVDQWQALQLLAIEDVTVVRIGEDTIFTDREGRLLTLGHPIPNYIAQIVRKRIESSAPTLVPGVSVCIFDSFATNYCHWILDWLPRFLLARQAIAGISNLVTFHEPKLRYEIESLRLLKPRQIIHFDNVAQFRFEKLIHVSEGGYNAHPLFHGHSGVRERLLADLEFKRTRTPKRRLYIPRRNKRRILNEEELWTRLQEAHFERIEPETMPLSEQMAAFSSAEAIVAPHGAALANLIFCSGETEVLELFPQFGGSAAYYVIATSGGLNYSCYMDDVTNPKFTSTATSNMLTNNSSFLVNLRWLDTWLSDRLLRKTTL